MTAKKFIPLSIPLEVVKKKNPHTNTLNTRVATEPADNFRKSIHYENPAIKTEASDYIRNEHKLKAERTRTAISAAKSLPKANKKNPVNITKTEPRTAEIKASISNKNKSKVEENPVKRPSSSTKPVVKGRSPSQSLGKKGENQDPNLKITTNHRILKKITENTPNKRPPQKRAKAQRTSNEYSIFF